MAGYSGTPLLKKLGLKPGSRLLLVNAPENYMQLTGPFPEDCVLSKTSSKAGLDFIHLFCKDLRTFLKNYDPLKAALRPDGMFWVSWPKKSSGVVTDLTEDIIRDHALQNGLVDVKVCAVDEVWSGLKLMYRLKDRK